jgi:hypothetical protein
MKRQQNVRLLPAETAQTFRTHVPVLLKDYVGRTAVIEARFRHVNLQAFAALLETEANLRLKPAVGRRRRAAAAEA